MTTGTVRFFNQAEGYGFVTPDDGGPDVFVHVSAVEAGCLPNLRPGQRVSFVVVTEFDKIEVAHLQAA